MKNSVALCHIKQSTSDLWEDALQSGISDLSAATAQKLLSRFIEYINHLAPEEIFLSFEKEGELSKKISQGLKASYKTLPYGHELGLLKAIFKESSADYVLYLDSVFGLADFSLTDKLYSIHTEYCADYSVVENAPGGLSGVFFSRSVFEAMEINQGEENVESIDKAIPESLPVGFQEYIEKNINRFHVEVHFEHPDLRMLRLDFGGKSKRSVLSMGDVLENIQAEEAVYPQLEKLFFEKPGLLYHFPSYLELEVFGKCDYACTFCPRLYATPLDNDLLSTEDIAKILEYSKKGLDDSVITLGGLGEPLQHPEIEKIVEMILKEKSVPMVIVETNGKNLNRLFSLLEHSDVGRLRLVVNVNSLDQYHEIHKTAAEDKETVLKNIEKCAQILEKKNPAYKKNIYVQSLKITDNERQLDVIYDFTDKTGISFLLQKYNTYNDLMPQKRVSDMTPLERSFCWHLRRDLYVRANGDVAFCKQDIGSQKIRGNIRKDDIEQIAKSCRSDWEKNYRQKWPAEPDCAVCDEYFTFNM